MRPTNSKQQESDKLSAQVKEYLSRGGRIKSISSNDQKPVNLPYNYTRKLASTGTI